MTDRYGVIGQPIAHSKSPLIHRLFAEQTGQDIAYDPIEISPEALLQGVRNLFAQGYRGLNVTLPHKRGVLPLTARLTPRAEIAGAVNTLILRDGGLLEGDNTDGAGLVTDLCQNLGLSLATTRVLILGAGGAARGIVPALLATGPQEIVIANRTPAGATVLAKDFRRLGQLRACQFAEVAGERFDLIINATSAGVLGEALPFPPPFRARKRSAMTCRMPCRTPPSWSGLASRVHGKWLKAGGCWWSRRQKPFSAGVECGPRPSPLSPDCPLTGKPPTNAWSPTLPPLWGESPRCHQSLFGGPQPQGYRKALQHFVRPGPQNMATHHLFFHTSRHQFHPGLGFSVGDAVVEGHELSGVNLYLRTKALPGFRFAEPAGADGRVAEHHRRNILVIQMPARLQTKHPVHGPSSRRHCHRRQCLPTRHITHCINMGHIGDLKKIGGDKSPFIQRHSSGLQAQIPGRGLPTNSPEHRVEGPRLTTVLTGEQQSSVPNRESS